MAKIISIIRKDIRLYFASQSLLIFFIVLPIVFTAVLAITTGAFGGGPVVLALCWTRLILLCLPT